MMLTHPYLTNDAHPPLPALSDKLFATYFSQLQDKRPLRLGRRSNSAPRYII